MQQGPEAAWRAHLAEGRFMIQRDPATGEHRFPPCTAATGGGPLEWVPAAGGGTVYSVTVVRPRPPAEPYNVVLVDLDEGVRVMSRVEGVEAGAVRIGLRVAAHVGEQDGAPVLLFHPA
jgi:uncharacterized OB-fold protein